MTDGFIRSDAYVGARSCPYCALFKTKKGHAKDCSWRLQFERGFKAGLKAATKKGATNEKTPLPPLTKTLSFNIDPYQGAARMVAGVDPPKGYKFQHMKRTKTKVTITFSRIDS